MPNLCWVLEVLMLWITIVVKSGTFASNYSLPAYYASSIRC